MGQRSIQEGEGWRIGWDEGAPHYPGLLAGSTWAMELTAPEFGEVCRLAQQLAQQMQAMAEVLMAEETLTCDAESDLVWVEVTGFPAAFTLRFILQSGRRGEGSWDATATQALLRVMATFSTQPF
ncbi:hypothetical protein GFS31_11330 [Leptolyngbya sp. BL0902]|uniref:DUF1818 family protein n=1 Tax=Leptolyngbya sp. BL0902 TaxID=1115757 RepID=UPI0018E73907|nr:DUF1818 family protein [Leptolyngbya sp. BL0902]QQE64452.1 hypothetical protein GFS31_11330 [Leptolyngbya sp. BL0902]